MSISRGAFLLGAGAGLILPSYYEKVLAFWDNRGEVYLEAPPVAKVELAAVDLGYGNLELNWGEWPVAPSEMTVREFARRYFGGEQGFVEEWYTW